MKILLAHCNYRIAGGEDRYVEEERELLSARHDVHVYLKRNETLPGGIRTATSMLYSPSRLREVQDILDEIRPDLVHLHNAYPAIGPAVHLASKKRRVPLVMTLHNFRLRCPNAYAFTEGSPCTRCVGGAYHNAALHRCFPSRSQGAGYAFALWVHRFVIRHERLVDLFICPSRFIADRMMEWGIPQGKIKIVRNFTSMRTPSDAPPREMSGAYVGRLSSEKGLDVLVRGLAIAGDPPFSFVGDGPLKEELRKAADELGLQRTTFTGRLDPAQVARVLASARYLVLPSLWDENAPLAALEAMRLGTPLIVTDRGGLPELAADERGVVVPPGSPQALASAISLLTERADIWERASRNSVSFVEAECQPSVHLAGLEEAFSAAALGR